jgi:hypothetical protein
MLSLRVTNLAEAIAEDGGGTGRDGFQAWLVTVKDAMMPLL